MNVKILSQIFLFCKCYPDLSNFYISLKFLHSFLKTVAKIFLIAKLHQNFRIPSLSVFRCFSSTFPTFLRHFEITLNFLQNSFKKSGNILEFHYNFSITLRIDCKMYHWFSQNIYKALHPTYQENYSWSKIFEKEFQKFWLLWFTDSTIRTIRTDLRNVHVNTKVVP